MATEQAEPAHRLDKKKLFEDLGYEPHEGQKSIHESPAPRRVLAAGSRWGKSTCAAMEAIAAAMEPAERSIGWICAPTYDLASRIFDRIVVLVAGHLRHRIVSLKEHDQRLVLRNMGGGLSEIRGKSADNPVSLLGEGLDWLIVDEAARLQPKIWQNFLSPRLLDKQGWALLISTPRGKGWFFDAYQRGQGRDVDYQSWNWPSWTSPLLDRDKIEAERARLPERVFLQEYGGQFLEGSGQVFRFVREAAARSWQEPEREARYYAGLDLAKTEDFSVLVIIDKKRNVVFFDRFHRLDWAIQIGRIKAACDRFNKARLLIDSTGAGEPILESLQGAGCRVDGYSFTQASKAALINNLSVLLEMKKVGLPRPEICPDLIDELEAFEYSISDAGNVRTGAPSGTHDDCVIALSLAVWQRRRSECMPSISVCDARTFELIGPRPDPDW